MLKLLHFLGQPFVMQQRSMMSAYAKGTSGSTASFTSDGNDAASLIREANSLCGQTQARHPDYFFMAGTKHRVATWNDPHAPVVWRFSAVMEMGRDKQVRKCTFDEATASIMGDIFLTKTNTEHPLWKNFWGFCNANAESPDDESRLNAYSKLQMAYCFETYCGSFAPEMFARTGTVFAYATRGLNRGGGKTGKLAVYGRCRAFLDLLVDVDKLQIASDPNADSLKQAERHTDQGQPRQEEIKRTPAEAYGIYALTALNADKGYTQDQISSSLDEYGLFFAEDTGFFTQPRSAFVADALCVLLAYRLQCVQENRNWRGRQIYLLPSGNARPQSSELAAALPTLRGQDLLKLHQYILQSVACAIDSKLRQHAYEASKKL